MPWCTYCGQSFTRDEHLERHILTHTNVKPYKCPNCFMSFARRDLLQRHYLVHGRDPDQQDGEAGGHNGMLPKSAGRTPIACHNCAKTKTKCDKKFPCTRCASRNLTCTVRPTRRATKSTRSVEQTNNASSIAAPVSKVDITPPSSGSSSDDRTTPDQQPKSVPTDSSMLSSNESHPLSHRELQSPTDLDSQVSLNHDPVASPILASRKCSYQSDSPQLSYRETEQVGSQHIELPLNISNTPDYLLDWSQMQTSTDPVDCFDQLHLSRQDLVFGAPMDLDPNLFSHVHQEDYQTIFPHQSSATAAGYNILSALSPNPTTAVPTYCFSQATEANVAPFSHELNPSRFLDEESCSFDRSLFPEWPQDLRPSASVSSTSIHMDAVIAGQDAWSVFRCMPYVPLRFCPKTAHFNLQQLAHILKSEDTWTSFHAISIGLMFEGSSSSKAFHIQPLQEVTRDKMLAITQNFLHKALELYSEEVCINNDDLYNLGTPIQGRNINTGAYNQVQSQVAVPPSRRSNFLILPPTTVLEHFLHSFTCTFEEFYPLISRGVLDANDLMRRKNTDLKASCLLILLMIAQGALVNPCVGSRWLTCGLTEVCRIGLFDLVEKSTLVVTDTNLLHSALLFTSLSAWSGDKWQMDIAISQGKMYFAMLKHSDLIQGSQKKGMTPLNIREDTELLWEEWIQQESRSRLVYAWAMIDQDIALFHDSTPLLSVHEFDVPLPCPDSLWRAKSSGDWLPLYKQMQNSVKNYSITENHPLSLRGLFSQFIDPADTTTGRNLTALQLRLLLYPLQALVFQYRQLVSCSSSITPSNKDVSLSAGSNNSRTRSFTAKTKLPNLASSTQNRLAEVRTLLQRWFVLAEQYLRVTPLCPLMQSALVVFHLTSLNTVTNFAEVETLARRESKLPNFNDDGTSQGWTYAHIMRVHATCIENVPLAVFHAGQVLRVVRSMSCHVRPPWWAGAVYRSALVLWCDSLRHNDAMSTTSANRATFAVDNLAPDHPLIVKYLATGEGVPVLTQRDGSQMGIDNAFAILYHCIDVLAEGVESRFVEGIAGKLDRLAKS